MRQIDIDKHNGSWPRLLRQFRAFAMQRRRFADKASHSDTARKYWKGQTDAQHACSDTAVFQLWAEEVVAILSPGGVLLDVGCGACQLTVHLADSFDRVAAFDFSESMLDAGRKRVAALEKTRIMILPGEATRFPVESNCADKILMFGVMQDLDDSILEQHLAECDRVLKPGGLIVWGHVPDANLRWLWHAGALESPRPPWFTMLWRLARAVWNTRRANAQGDLRWDGIGRWFTREELRDKAEGAGFAIEFRHSWFRAYRYHALLRRRRNKSTSRESKNGVGN